MKEYFFSDVEDLRSVLPVTTSFDFNGFKPFLFKAAIKYFRNDFGIGKPLFDEILSSYNSGYDSLTDKKKELISMIRLPLANMAMASFTAIATVRMGVDGITTDATDGKTPLKKWQQEELKDQFLNDGFDGIELLLDWLEENKANFSTWTSSNAYTVFKDQFIATVSEFQQCYALVSSRRTFLAIKHIMNRIDESVIKKVLPEDKYTEIKNQVKVGSVQAENKPVVLLIRTAIAHLTMAKAFDELSIAINQNGVQVLGIGTNTENQKTSAGASEIKIQRLKDSAQATGESCVIDLRKLSESGFTSPTGDRGNDPDSKIYFV